VAGRHFQVFFRRNGQGDARLGIVAGRKAAGIAARRNFARRLVRETFRLARAGLPDADFVVRVTRPLVRGDAATAREELNELLLEASRQCRAC
jgi:ribonuclease P protein component